MSPTASRWAGSRGRASGWDAERGTGPDPALAARVRARLVESGLEPTASRVAAAVRAEVILVGSAAALGERSGRQVAADVRAQLRGAGPLQRLINDPAVTDVLVNAGRDVWLDRGEGLVRVDVALGTADDVRLLAQRLAASAGRRLDDACPWVDARLPDGTRLHAVLPPISPGGTVLSLRMGRRHAFTLDELETCGTLGPVSGPVVRALIARRRAILVTGGTGSGKTTFLAALLGAVDPGERLVLVEDVGELRPRHPHVVRLEARAANVEGAGEVTLRDLVRQAMRMRPDRIIVGEARGPEVLDLLGALNTGHEGGLATLHARGPAEVPARVDVLAAPERLGREAVHGMLFAAFDAVVHLRRDADGRRRVSEVAVLRAGPGGTCEVLNAVVGEVRTVGWPLLAAACGFGERQ